MTKRVLVAYASRYGSTEEVAERVAEVLKKQGLGVDLVRAKEVKDISGYDAVVIGSPVIAFRWLGGARRFLKKHTDALGKIPVACFALGLTLMEDTEKNRSEMLKRFKPIIEKVKPVDIGLFGGRWDKKRAGFFMRLFPLPEGDWRKWDKIEAWAEGLPDKLK